MRIVVCGAGISGLSLAHRLSALGIEVVLLERAPGPRTQGYMIDFFGPGYDAIRAMGLLEAVEEVAYQIAEVSFVDERGRHRAGIRPDQVADGPLLNLMRPDLEAVLHKSLPPEVDLRFGANVEAVTDHGDGVTATLADGTALEADLLVGADGIHSTVRRHVFGPERDFLRYLGFHTAAFGFESPRIRAELQGRACLTDTVGSMMGFYGLDGDRVAAFAVHRTPDPELPPDPRSAIVERYGGLGWIVPEVLRACPPSSSIYYDQVAQIVLPRWSKGRVVLVGDAAYAVSLLAGQGASLGIAGAYVLAEQLATVEQIPAALDRYEQQWRPVAEGKQRTGRGAAGWFLPPSKAHLRLRRATLRLARLPGAQRLLAKTLGGMSTKVIAGSSHR